MYSALCTLHSALCTLHSALMKYSLISFLYVVKSSSSFLLYSEISVWIILYLLLYQIILCLFLMLWKLLVFLNLWNRLVILAYAMSRLVFVTYSVRMSCILIHAVNHFVCLILWNHLALLLFYLIRLVFLLFLWNHLVLLLFSLILFEIILHFYLVLISLFCYLFVSQAKWSLLFYEVMCKDFLLDLGFMSMLTPNTSHILLNLVCCFFPIWFYWPSLAAIL